MGWCLQFLSSLALYQFEPRNLRYVFNFARGFHATESRLYLETPGGSGCPPPGVPYVRSGPGTHRRLLENPKRNSIYTLCY